jgi:acyl-CoA hydrolase
MIALDDNDKPIPVPRLLLETEDEELAWQHGEERKKIRTKRKQDKLDGI